MQKTVLKNHTSFIILILLHLFILSNCGDKKKNSYVKIDPSVSETYIIKTKTKTYNVVLDNKHILINDTPHSIILLNIFNPTSSSCLTHAQTLQSLEHENKDIRVVNITKSTQDKENINFINKIYQTLAISSHALTMLSILYINGRYYQHYEGLTPIEMIQHDISQNQINQRI